MVIIYLLLCLLFISACKGTFFWANMQEKTKKFHKKDCFLRISRICEGKKTKKPLLFEQGLIVVTKAINQ